MIINRTVSMRHVGMNREAIRTVVKNRLSIGQQYQLQSGRDHSEDKRFINRVRCRLVSFSRNAAVFEHKNGTRETFTYQELWQMLMEEEIL